MAQWSRPVAIPNQTSKTTPALAFIDSRLHMIHLGASSDQLWHSVWDAGKREWSPNVRMGKESSGRVALAQDGLLVYQSKEIGSDGERGLVHSLYYGPWTPSKPLPDNPRTSDAPAVVLVFNNTWTVVRRVPHKDFQLRASHYRLDAGEGGPSALERREQLVVDAAEAAVGHDGDHVAFS
jgi:hypothetical protein